MEFNRYASAPRNVQEELVEKFRAEKEAKK
jgi:hypothetical protein